MAKAKQSNSAPKGNTGSGQKKAASPPPPSNALTQYGINGNFGGQAYTNARNAGLTDEQIRGLVGGSGLNVGMGVQAALNPGQFDEGWTKENASDLAQRGYYGSGLPSQDGNNYKLQPYVLPYAVQGGLGPNGNVLFMADPGQRGSTYNDQRDWLLSRYQPSQGGAAPVQSQGQSQQSFDANAYNQRLVEQQAAVWASMDAMNSQFLQQQQDWLNQQQALRQPLVQGGSVGTGSPDQASVKRKKPNKRSQASSTTNSSLGIGGGSGVSLGGASAGKTLGIG